MISKLVTFSSMSYLVFIVANLGQLEISGRYEVTGSCVLALTNCRPNFVICDQTKNLTKAEFTLINSILRKSFLQIREGNLESISHNPKIINMTDMTTEAMAMTQKVLDVEGYLVDTPRDVEGKLI